MTPWDRLRDRFDRMPDQNRRRWVFVGLASLIAFVMVVFVGPWALWPLVVIALWLVAIGAVVYVAVRLALRN